MSTARNRFILALSLLTIFAPGCFGQANLPRPEQLRLDERLSELSIQFPSEIKELDGGTVRVFLRLRLASVLWSEPGEKSAGAATALCVAALQDLEEEKDSIPPLYTDLFRRDLIALLEAHAPELAKKYKGSGAGEPSQTTVDTAYSLLNTKGQEDLAISLLSKGISDSQISGDSDWTTILFFLDHLAKQKPDRLPNVLSSLLSAEERNPGTISIEGMFLIAHLYLDNNRSIELKTRFVAVSINATSQSYAWSDARQLTDAYDVLRIVLPFASTLTPSLYPRASAQLSSLMARLSREAEREQVETRIRSSDDPLQATISEAKSASDVGLKDELFSQAAQSALKEAKLQLAFESATSVSSEGKHQQWRDQFLEELVKAAINKRDSEFAAVVIPKIEDPYHRAAALQVLSLYFLDSKNATKAREAFSEELKTIDAADDKTRKAVAFLRSLALFIKLSDGPLSNFTDPAVKYINSIPILDDKSDRAAKTKYVSEVIMPLAWELLPEFEVLSQHDESTALAVIDQIQNRELRLVARLGVSKGRLNLAKANLAAITKGSGSDVQQKRPK
jgi:hypothetical protein